jgi:hypothetical protein
VYITSFYQVVLFVQVTDVFKTVLTEECGCKLIGRLKGWEGKEMKVRKG